MIYIKVDKTHLSAAADIEIMRTQFNLAFPDNILSVADNEAGTQAWVKMDSSITLTVGVELDRADPGAEHLTKVQADIYSVAWPQEP